MKLVKGNVFDHNDLDFICVTTNSILNKKGELVMGAGIALEAKNLYPELPSVFGIKVSKLGVVGGDYYILQHENILAFQTKRHYREKSPIDLVRKSINRLKFLATVFDDKVFGLPFPAINNGGLKKEDVLPILFVLPDNVLVFELED